MELADPPLSAKEFAAELALVEPFRATYRTLLQPACMGLRSFINSEGLQAIEVTQRHKRMRRSGIRFR